MKKILSLLLILAMVTMMFASCGGNNAETPTTESSSSSESTSGTQSNPDPTPSYAENLVMHLDFDSWNGTTVTDASGNGHDATAFGGAAKADSYNGSSAAQLKANGDYFVVKIADDLNFTEKDSYTISLWYCFDENTGFSKWPCIINKGFTSSSKDCYLVTIANSSSSKGVYFTASALPTKGNVNLNASSDTELNKWHHFVMVQDAAKGTITTYVDGVRGEFLNYPANASTPTDLFIGAMGETVGQRQFLGKLDDIQIYDCALSESYIQGFTKEENKVILDTKAENGETVTVTDAETDGFFAGEGFTLSVKFNRTGDSKPGDIVKKDAGKGTYGFSLDEQNRLIMHAG